MTFDELSLKSLKKLAFVANLAIIIRKLGDFFVRFINVNESWMHYVDSRSNRYVRSGDTILGSLERQ